MNIVLFCLPVVFLVASVFMAIRSVKNGKKTRRAVATQLISFAIVCVVALAVPMAVSAATSTDAAGNTTTSAQASADNSKGFGFLAAALAVGLSGIGGGIAVSAGSSAAIGATSEDPKAFGKAIIFVALGEGVALYGLLISILILQKL